jgi:hypothetical protein
MRTVPRSASTFVLTLLTLTGVSSAFGLTAEERCRGGLYAAAGAYERCEQKVLEHIYGGRGYATLQEQFLKCRTKYVAIWEKLAAKAAQTGSSCDAERFVDGGLTVRDNLTGLEWETKTEDASVHDKGARYTWSANGGADGEAFTTFLRTLNDACFAGQCDWRLPTFSELQTIVNNPCFNGGPCTYAPLEPMDAVPYWTATIFGDDRMAWLVSFFDTATSPNFKQQAWAVRAVRRFR